MAATDLDTAFSPQTIQCRPLQMVCKMFACFWFCIFIFIYFIYLFTSLFRFVLCSCQLCHEPAVTHICGKLATKLQMATVLRIVSVAFRFHLHWNENFSSEKARQKFAICWDDGAIRAALTHTHSRTHTHTLAHTQCNSAQHTTVPKPANWPSFTWVLFLFSVFVAFFVAFLFLFAQTKWRPLQLLSWLYFFDAVYGGGSAASATVSQFVGCTHPQTEANTGTHTHTQIQRHAHTHTGECSLLQAQLVAPAGRQTNVAQWNAFPSCRHTYTALHLSSGPLSCACSLSLSLSACALGLPAVAGVAGVAIFAAMRKSSLPLALAAFLTRRSAERRGAASMELRHVFAHRCTARRVVYAICRCQLRRQRQRWRRWRRRQGKITALFHCVSRIVCACSDTKVNVFETNLDIYIYIYI